MKCAVLLTAGACFAIGGCQEKASPTVQAEPVGGPAAASPSGKANIFSQMRDGALAYRGTSADSRVTNLNVHGIVVDWGVAAGTATVVFMNDGSASLYLSGGGGTIGAGSSQQVVDSGKKVLAEAVKVKGQLAKVTSVPLPKADEMRFTLITDDGLFTAADTVERLSNGVGPLVPLGNSVQELIHYIHAVDEQGRKKGP